MPSTKPNTPKPGRKLSFDRQEALYRAMLLFWEHGYEATSINDLVTHLGITPPSLYTAFGSKKQLFLEVVELYSGDPILFENSLTKIPTSKKVVESVLQYAAIKYTGADTPAGCLNSTSVLSLSKENADLWKVIADKRTHLKNLIRAKIEADQAAKRVADACDAEALAALAMAVLQGLATLARDGMPRKQLMLMIEVFLEIWPDKNTP